MQRITLIESELEVIWYCMKIVSVKELEAAKLASERRLKSARIVRK